VCDVLQIFSSLPEFFLNLCEETWVVWCRSLVTIGRSSSTHRCPESQMGLGASRTMTSSKTKDDREWTLLASPLMRMIWDLVKSDGDSWRHVVGRMEEYAESVGSNEFGRALLTCAVWEMEKQRHVRGIPNTNSAYVAAEWAGCVFGDLMGREGVTELLGHLPSWIASLHSNPFRLCLLFAFLCASVVTSSLLSFSPLSPPLPIHMTSSNDVLASFFSSLSRVMSSMLTSSHHSSALFLLSLLLFFLPHISPSQCASDVAASVCVRFTPSPSLIRSLYEWREEKERKRCLSFFAENAEAFPMSLTSSHLN
jgi:hypothetical protein